MIVHRCKQGSDLWRELRTGKPTASVFDQIVTPTGKLSASSRGLLHRLAAERILGYPLESPTTKAMEAGREGEPKARAWYELAYDCEVEQVGVCFTDDGRIGASPDGLIGPNGSIEIKCPEPQTHVGYMLSGNGAYEQYKCQVQGQLWVCEREWLDTVSFCLPFASIVTRQPRDEEFIAKLSAAVREFADRLDEAVDRLLSMGCVAYTAPPVRPLPDWLEERIVP